jgi:hypothetical protein
VYHLQRERLEWQTQPGHTETVFGLAFSAHDPDLLASCAYDGTIRVWDLRSMRCATLPAARFWALQPAASSSRRPSWLRGCHQQGQRAGLGDAHWQHCANAVHPAWQVRPSAGGRPVRPLLARLVARRKAAGGVQRRRHRGAVRLRASHGGEEVAHTRKRRHGAQVGSTPVGACLLDADVLGG